ncbi:MAG: transglycosylase SLT domain-containing protein [Pseudomonadota bacterium]
MTKDEQGFLVGNKVVRSALLALCLGSCASGPPDPPRVQDDVCAIFAERPDWYDAALSSSLRWGAPVDIVMAIIWRESSFRAQARPPKRYALGFIPRGRPSSAYGYAQAIDGTWAWYRKETGRSGADRDDFEDAVDFVGWYMAKTRVSNGVGMADAFTQYINYHEGHRGYRRMDWRGKRWLTDIAVEVADRAALYRAQLPGCRL